MVTASGSIDEREKRQTHMILSQHFEPEENYPVGQHSVCCSSCSHGIIEVDPELFKWGFVKIRNKY